MGDGCVGGCNHHHSAGFLGAIEHAAEGHEHAGHAEGVGHHDDDHDHEPISGREGHAEEFGHVAETSRGVAMPETASTPAASQGSSQASRTPAAEAGRQATPAGEISSKAAAPFSQAASSSASAKGSRFETSTLASQAQTLLGGRPGETGRVGHALFSSPVARFAAIVGQNANEGRPANAETPAAGVRDGVTTRQGTESSALPQRPSENSPTTPNFLPKEQPKAARQTALRSTPVSQVEVKSGEIPAVPQTFAKGAEGQPTTRTDAPVPRGAGTVPQGLKGDAALASGNLPKVPTQWVNPPENRPPAGAPSLPQRPPAEFSTDPRALPRSPTPQGRESPASPIPRGQMMSARETQQEKMRLALQWAASDKGEKGELKEADDQDPLNRVARKEEELAEDSHHQEETPDQERDGQLVDNDLHYS